MKKQSLGGEGGGGGGGGGERYMLLDIQQRLTCMPGCTAQETSALNFVLVG